MLREYFNNIWFCLRVYLILITPEPIMRHDIKKKISTFLKITYYRFSAIVAAKNCKQRINKQNTHVTENMKKFLKIIWWFYLIRINHLQAPKSTSKKKQRKEKKETWNGIFLKGEIWGEGEVGGGRGRCGGVVRTLLKDAARILDMTPTH